VGRRRSPAATQVRRIVWSDEAVANLESIATYINDFSPLAARRLALRLKTAADSLSEHPERGRHAGEGLRELTVIYPL
jgi:toxin ParE1/3/4